MTSLVSKIAKAALEVGGKLSADKTNQEQKYDYISADKINSVSGQALASQGVMVIPQVDAVEISVLEYTDKWNNAKRRYDSRVNFTFTVTDGETEIKTTWVGFGCDYTTPDKASYKAITSGHKYYMMKLLCIGAGNEDGEHEGGEDDEPRRVNGNGKQQPAPRPVQQPAPTNGKQDAPANPPKMTYETAVFTLNSQGVPYGEIPSDKLEYMEKSIHEALAKSGLAQSQKDAYNLKLAAIDAILTRREEQDEAARQAENE